MAYIDTVFLCDQCAVQDGKLSCIGGGWDTLGLPSLPTTLDLHFVLRLHASWEDGGEAGIIRFDVADPDGTTLVLDPPPGGGFMNYQLHRGGVEVGRDVHMFIGATIHRVRFTTYGAHEFRITMEHGARYVLPFRVLYAPTQTTFAAALQME